MTRRSFGSALKPDPAKRRRAWGVHFVWKGTRVIRRAGMKRSDATTKLAAAEALLKGGADLSVVLAEVFGDFLGTKMTFRDAVDPYLAHAETRNRASTMTNDRTRLAAISAAPWTSEFLGNVTPAMIAQWVETRRAPRDVVRRRTRRPGESIAEYRKAKDKMVRATVQTSGATLNRDLAIVSALFRWARRLGYVEDNPVKKVDRFSEKGGARETYLTAPEAAALVEASSPVLRPVVVVALSTGMRRGELLALRWRAVDLDRREVLVESATAKSGKTRTIPLTAQAHTALVALKAARRVRAMDGSDRVFVASDGSTFTAKMLRSSFVSAVLRCDAIPVAKRQALRFHDLRHTFASLAVGAGVSLFTVSRLLGHGTIRMTERYAHFAPEAGRAAIDRLGEVFDVTETAKGLVGSR